MDSRIPKPSGLKKPTANFFDFKSNKSNEADENMKKRPLAELGNISALAQVKFTTTDQRAKSPDIARSKPFVQPKLRRSKSALDIRTGDKFIGGKRFQPTLDSIPNRSLAGGIKRLQPSQMNASNKRLKPASSQPIRTVVAPIKTQEKKTAILNSLKSTTLPTIAAARKAVLTKTNSDPPAKKEVASKATTKNIAALSRPPPYDYKARHGVLLEKFKALKARNEEQKEQMTSLEEQNEKFEFNEKELMAKLEKLENDLVAANTHNADLKEQMALISTTNTQLNIKNIALATSLAASSDELSDLKFKHAELQSQHEQVTFEFNELKEKSGSMESDFKNASTKLIMSQEQLYSMNIERKVLHNMVLDLRGNIRVFCRVRPPLPSEEDRSLCAWQFVDESSLEIHSNELAANGSRKQTKHDFSFDQVFDPNSRQDDIFEMVSPLIQSALDGYNVCIFAYGQTGSGKTFTMDGAGENPGIIPRTVRLLFDSLKTSAILGWQYDITASFLEIYNEVFYDLLSNETKDIEIRMANAKSKTEIYVSNITEVEVKNAARLHELMNVARNNRATAATVGNERSSRSHAVTRLQIVGKHASKPETLVGHINLVDLAGSESPKTSIRMDETKNINRSLSELSNVILALVQKNEHVPYRNSKLTHLLMPCLGGNSKTLMFVNVSPFQDCFVESVKSLRFAAQVNSCKTAKAKRNRQLNSSNIF